MLGAAGLSSAIALPCAMGMGTLLTRKERRHSDFSAALRSSFWFGEPSLFLLPAADRRFLCSPPTLGLRLCVTKSSNNMEVERVHPKAMTLCTHTKTGPQILTAAPCPPASADNSAHTVGLRAGAHTALLSGRQLLKPLTAPLNSFTLKSSTF